MNSYLATWLQKISNKAQKLHGNERQKIIMETTGKNAKNVGFKIKIARYLITMRKQVGNFKKGVVRRN